MKNYTNTNDNINIYFSEIRKSSNPSCEDEVELFKRMRSGDESASTEIFNMVSRLAVKIAKLYTCDPELLEDLIQEANIGSLRAMEDFDPSHGYKFTTYARWWMIANITKFINDQGVVGITFRAPAKRCITKIKEKFLSEHCREITQYELLEELEKCGETITDIDCLIGFTSTSIDNSKGDDEDDMSFENSTLFNSKTSSSNEYEKKVELEDLRYEISNHLSVLDERAREFVLMYFGIGYEMPMTYEMIANRFKLNEERVRQIVVNSLNKIRK